MKVSDGFKFGIGLWLATMTVGTVWLVIVSLMVKAIVG